MQVIQAKQSLIDFLTDLKTTQFDLAVMNLFLTDMTPTVDTVLADMDVATFTGYAPVTLTSWLAPFFAGAKGIMTSPIAHFATASPYTVGNAIYGGWIENAGGDLLFAFRFDNAPLPMNAALQAIEMSMQYEAGNPVGVGFCVNV